MGSSNRVESKKLDKVGLDLMVSSDLLDKLAMFRIVVSFDFQSLYLSFSSKKKKFKKKKKKKNREKKIETSTHVKTKTRERFRFLERVR